MVQVGAVLTSVRPSMPRKCTSRENQAACRSSAQAATPHVPGWNGIAALSLPHIRLDCRERYDRRLEFARLAVQRLASRRRSLRGDASSRFRMITVAIARIPRRHCCTSPNDSLTILCLTPPLRRPPAGARPRRHAADAAGPGTRAADPRSRGQDARAHDRRRRVRPGELRVALSRRDLGLHAVPAHAASR